MRQGIFKKTLLLIIILSLIPFIFINIYYYIQLKNISDFAIRRSKKEFDKKSINSLINQANQISKRISDFLYNCVDDLKDVSLMPPSHVAYSDFLENHLKYVYQREPTFASGYFLTKKKQPVYFKILFTDLQGKTVAESEKSDFSDKILNSIEHNKIFNKIKSLKTGEIFFSHLIGGYVSQKEALAGADSPENAIGGKKYRGYYIIAAKTSLFGGGIIYLYLNHRHIMEFVQHVLPNSSQFIDYPVYSSGNYAFLVDDEGWTIAHPKLWDIKGYDKSGNLVPPYSTKTPNSLKKEGFIPFNLATAGFIHKNYPIVLKHLRDGKFGCVNTTNIGGIKKVMAYAPIFFNIGDYSKFGIFGGVTIGAKLKDFHKAALITKEIINQRYILIKNKIFLITLIIFVLIITGSLLFTSEITAPVIMLSRRFTELGKGKFDNLKVNFKRNDEIGIMGEEFNRMIDLIKENNDKLSKTIRALEDSKKELEFKVNLLDGIREFFTKFDQKNKIENVINSILLIGKKIFQFDYGYIKLFDVSKEFSIGFPADSDIFKLTGAIIVENSAHGIILFIRKEKDFSSDERENFEIFNISLSKFLENLKLYSEIIRERNFIENIFKNMINGLIYIDKDGYITHINDMALKMFNLKENPRNKKFREAFAQMPGLLDFYLNTIKGTQYMVYELQFGEKFYGCSSSIVEKSNGIIMIFRDITEKKLTDEHLKRVDRLISLGRVAAGIAHEIRNPLTGINLLLEDLHDKLEKEDRDLIKKSLDEITRLENIVSELLDYASPVKEGFGRFMLSEIIETSVFFIQKQAKNRNIRITNRVKDNVKLHCSMDKLKQAIINILLNAIEAVEKNGEILIESEILGNNVILSIKDTGCGIDEKNIKYIFDPFFTTKTKGTGLGLSITHSIIHEHQGKISVDSKKGEGTKFTIVLPIE